jgi:catechol 2,3-dioxygenase-like lactoylglutathione lyase family enzyme
MQTFLEDFGLVVQREGDVLYSRGTDPSPWLHQTVQGDPGFCGMGFDAGSDAALEQAARLDGAGEIEPLDGPGGGRRVRFRDPDGYHVEVVAGRTPAEPLPRRTASPYNWGSVRAREGTLQRVPIGASSVKRIGHCVVRVSDFRKSEDWYRSRFGFAVSDEVYLGDPNNVITAFLRCDRGEQYSDHHTFLCVGVGEPGFDHAAFEVEDLDAVMAGHEHLEKAGYEHHAGIGRHFLGSQIFDYWRDPWGHVLEHFTDGDLLNASHQTERHAPDVALGTQWGRFGP